MPAEMASILKPADPKGPVTVTVRDATHARAARAADLLSELEDKSVSIGEVYDRCATAQLDVLLAELDLPDFPDKKADLAAFNVLVAKLKGRSRR